MWQLRSVHQLREGIPKDVFVLPIVKAMLQFIQIEEPQSTILPAASHPPAPDSSKIQIHFEFHPWRKSNSSENLSTLITAERKCSSAARRS
jgi:hypothetical protein